MQMTIYNVKRFVTVILITGLVACVSSSTLSSRWHDPDYSGAPLNKVFVFAVVNKEANRRSLEDSYVARLKKQGVTGIASYTLIPDPEKAYEEKQLKAIISKTNADAVLISRLVGVSTEKTEIPPRAGAVHVAPHRGYYGHYNTAHHAAYQPGYTQVDKVVTLTTKIFSIEKDKIVWDGSTKSFNPETAVEVINEITDLIVDDLKSSGLIGD
jgi:hypothetical protein